MNKQKYKDILKIVNLEVNEFQGKDLIQVIHGAKNFSHSERIKILLARMMYSESGEIYIISNIFDKMGIENQKQLYSKIINGYLKSKTVIVTSQSHQILKMVDTVFYLDEKEIQFSGSAQTFYQSVGTIKKRNLAKVFQS
jgi:ABC-type transport system involved in cytochrome bd biosynthesis fused ATPase/permease subunit